jgi:hypothetical protein
MDRGIERLLNVRKAEVTNYIEVSSPPWPKGYAWPDPANLLRIKGMGIKAFQACDILSVSDHWLLKHDVAQILGLGVDVKRLYSARAFRFNQWAVRALTFLKSEIQEVEVSDAAVIAEINTWCAQPTTPGILKYEVRNAMIDFMDQGDVSRHEAEYILETLDAKIALAQSGGCTALLQDGLTTIQGIIDARNALFAGAQAALDAGMDPDITVPTGDPGWHIDAVEIKVAAMLVLRFVCIVTTSESCKDWEWVEELKKEIIREVKECRSTVPDNPT